MKKNRKSSSRWCELLNILVLDPDGWDRSSPELFKKSWNQKTTFDVFIYRMSFSTVNMLPSIQVFDNLQLKYLCDYGSKLSRIDNIITGVIDGDNVYCEL